MKKFLERRDKIRRVVAKQNLDALLITHPINVRYLTGFTGGAAYLLVQPGGDLIMSDSRFTIQLEEECPGLQAAIRPQGESTSQKLSKLLGKTTAGKLGIEAETMTVDQHARLLESIPRWQSVPMKGVVEELRQIKDRDEIAQIRIAIRIAAESLIFARTIIQQQLDSGVFELEEWLACCLLDNRMRILGAKDRSFPTIVGAGARAALPHANPSNQKIAGQSHLLFDWGAVVNGYMSDLTRVLIFDPNNKKLRTIYETVLKAQTAAIAAIKPGKTCDEIDTVARNIIKDAGFGKHFGHGLGHSLGLQIHENPRFRQDDKTVLKAGMVLTVEPGIYFKGWGGVRIEDDILVTRSGCEVLSKAVPKSFDAMVVEGERS